MGTLTEKPKNLQVIIWACVLILMLGVSLSNFHSYQLGTHFDDARYVILGRSLIASPVYGMINYPGVPEPGKYPFGYPIILAPFLLLFPGNLDVLQVSSLLATALIVVTLFWGWRWFFPEKSYWWGLAVTALYALAPLTIDHTRRVMSEPVFTLFCLVTILLANQYLERKKASWGWRIAISFTLIFTVFTRTIGFLLFTLIIVFMFIRIGWVFWKELARILGLMAAIVGLVVILTPVQLRDLFPSEYLHDENARFIVSIFKTSQSPTPAQTTPVPGGPLLGSPDPAINLRAKSSTLSTLVNYGLKQHFGSDLRVVVLPLGTGQEEQLIANQIGYPRLPIIIGYLISFLIAFGFFVLLRRQFDNLFLLFALVYFLAIFFWTWNDPRLLYPIQTQLIFAFLVGINTGIVWLAGIITRKSLPTGTKHIIACLLVLALFGISLYKSVQIQDSRIHAGDLRARTSWLLSHAGQNSIILSEAPEIDYIYSGRKTVAYPSPATASVLKDFLIRNNIEYILIAPEIRWQDTYQPLYSAGTNTMLLLSEVLRAEKILSQVYANDSDSIRIYRVTGGS